LVDVRISAYTYWFTVSRVATGLPFDRSYDSSWQQYRLQAVSVAADSGAVHVAPGLCAAFVRSAS
jgi:hypothetical protein